MAIKINGGNVRAGEALTGNMEWFTIRTTMPIVASGDNTDPEQIRLNRLVDVITMQSQAVISGGPRISVEEAPVADLPATSGLTGDVDVYTFKFSSEHYGAVDVERVMYMLNGIDGFVYDMPTTNNNISIVANDVL